MRNRTFLTNSGVLNGHISQRHTVVLLITVAGLFTGVSADEVSRHVTFVATLAAGAERQIEFDAASRVLLVGNNELDVFDVAGTSLSRPCRLGGSLIRAGFLSGGTRIQVVTADRVAIWDFTRGTMTDILTPSHYRILCSDVSSDGKLIALGCTDNMARIAALDGRGTTIVLRHPGSVVSIEFVGNGSRVLTVTEPNWKDTDSRETEASGAARLWSLRPIHQEWMFSAKPMPYGEPEVRLAKASPTGKYAIILDAGILRAVEVDSGKMLSAIDTKQGFSAGSVLAFNREGTEFATGGGAGQVWNAELHNEFIIGSDVRTGIFLPDGRAILFGGSARSGLWEIKSKTLLFAIRAHEELIPTIGMSADGKYFAASYPRSNRTSLWRSGIR